MEAEGSFYITKKGDSRYCYGHGFGLTQKKDKEILLSIREILKIRAEVKDRGSFYSLDSTGETSLKFIKDYFFKSMWSRKALVYRIWARSFKEKGKPDALRKIQASLRKLY